ncbi:MAG: lipid II flippase MurJ, partial [Planctomycetota bacterium]
LGEGALSTSFQTALTATDADHGDAVGARLFWSTLRTLLALLGALTLLVIGAVGLMPDRMPVTGWAWLGADPGAVRDLTVRVMPYVMFVCVSALFTGALHVRGRFGPPAIAPAAMNVVWIATLLVILWRFGVHGPSPAALGEGGLRGEARHLEMARWLAWGVLAAGAVQLAVQVPALRAAGFALRDRAGTLPASAAQPAQVLRRAAPLALGAAVYQVNVMVDGLMAEGLLSDGGPTLHYFANRVQQLPLALVAIAATSAVFPALQELGHAGKREALRSLHDRTHLAIAAVAVPAALGMFALARPIVEVSFERGAFGAEGVARTSRALAVLAFAILPAGATGLIARTYYAMGDFTTPVRVSIVALLLNVGFNVWFLVGLGMDVEGLAAATCITSVLNAVLLLPGLTRSLGLPRCREALLQPLGAILAAGTANAAVAFGVERALDGPLGRTAALGLAIAAGGVTYLALAFALRVPGLERFRRTR